MILQYLIWEAAVLFIKLPVMKHLLGSPGLGLRSAALRNNLHLIWRSKNQLGRTLGVDCRIYSLWMWLQGRFTHVPHLHHLVLTANRLQHKRSNTTSAARAKFSHLRQETLQETDIHTTLQKKHGPIRTMSLIFAVNPL